MAPTFLYTACVLGAIGLYLLVRSWPTRRGRTGADRSHSGHRNRVRAIRGIGAVLGLGALGFIFAKAGESLGTITGHERPETMFVIFSLIAIVSALKLITHRRPVYSALYFVLVVLSSAGLFLLLKAEFMAFALIIVYAGAIMITYMFVLMLAQQAPHPDDPHGQPEYDLHPRDPGIGAVVGFVLLALLTRVILEGGPNLPLPPSTAQSRVDSWLELERMPKRLEDAIAREVDGPFELDWVDVTDGTARPRMSIAADGTTASVFYEVPGETGPREFMLPAEARPENVQSVGLALVSTRFPFALELAGVILLMAMLGAVILARRQIELTDDEKRAAAGMRRLGHHDDPTPAGGSDGGSPGEVAS